jgi:FAD binding domain
MNAGMNIVERIVDVLVIGGGTAGPMAAIKANPALEVLLLEKANVKRSGAISMGMDGLNNAVIPGHATPEQCVREMEHPAANLRKEAALALGSIGDAAATEELCRARRDADPEVRKGGGAGVDAACLIVGNGFFLLRRSGRAGWAARGAIYGTSRPHPWRTAPDSRFITVF